MTMHTPRILCVEDDPDIQAVLRLALGMVGGFDVLLCGSGAEALANLGRYVPDLILLDVMMPDMDGAATLAALREEAGAALAPVIFMTAKSRPEEVAHLLSLGALGVIAKPFDPMTLAREVALLRERGHGV